MTSRMRIAGGSLAVICLISWWISRPLPTDAALTGLPTSSDLESLLWNTFDGPPLDSLGDQHTNIDAKKGFSHLRIRYSATHPFVVTINPAWIVENRYAFNTAERIGGVLPAGTDMTVTLPMSASVGWTYGTTQAVVYAYAPRNTSVQLASVEPFSAGIGNGLRQLASPEQWTLASVNFLRGYRIAGIALPVLLGLGMIITMITVRRSRTETHAAMLAAMIAITVFFARSGTDLLLGTLRAAYDWNTRGVLPELGDVVTMAHDLQDEDRPIATCGYSDAPVAYGIFPRRLVPVESADIAVMPTAWTTGNGGVICGNATVPGSILRTYPSGGGIAVLEHSPTAP